MTKLKLFAVQVNIDDSANRYTKTFHVFADTDENAKQYVRDHVNDQWTYIEKWISVMEVPIHDGLLIPSPGNRIY